MTRFEFGNTRLRGLKARFFAEADLAGLATAGSVERLLNRLTNSPYRQSVEEAMLQYSGLECLDDALRRDLITLGERIRNYFSGAAAAQCALVLEQYDVENVVAILRGLAQRQPPETILGAVLPVGRLQSADFSALAQLETMQDAVALLATWQSPLAAPLLELGNVRPARLFAAEIGLRRWYFRRLRTARAARGTVLPRVQAVEADLANLMTMLRLVGATGVESFLEQAVGNGDLEALFIGDGRIRSGLLVEGAHQEGVETAVALLDATPYGPMLQAALPEAKKTGRLYPFERGLIQYRRRFARRLIISDPLGIGVLWGVLVLKIGEQTNLRLIGQGLFSQDPPERIRDALILESERAIGRRG